MRKLNLLSMYFVLMVMLSCNHKPKPSVVEVNADSLSETIMNTAQVPMLELLLIGKTLGI